MNELQSENGITWGELKSKIEEKSRESGALEIGPEDYEHIKRELFDKMDVDGDGSVTRTDLKMFMK